MSMQITNMSFDPVSGVSHPFPANAQHYRMHNTDKAVWLFNPWTGTKRHDCDVSSDKYGVLIVPTGEPMIPSAPWPRGQHAGHERRSGLDRRAGDTTK